MILPGKVIDNNPAKDYNQLFSTILIRTPLIPDHTRPLAELSREVGGGRLLGHQSRQVNDGDWCPFYF